MKKSTLVSLVLLQYLATSSLNASELKPKYGPKGSPIAIPLVQSNDYFRDPGHPAPAFWALISYYIPQSTGASCATAALAMTLNAARAHLKQTVDDALITEKMLWDHVGTKLWKQLSGEQKDRQKYQGRTGVNLDDLAKFSEAAFKNYGFSQVKLKIVHVQNKLARTRITMLRDLKSLSDKTFIIANFNQKNFTDDADVGHFAPVGAYDEKRGRVLILDPDRGSGDLNGYYEPYWVSVDTFLGGIATLDPSAKTNRGYLIVNSRE